MGLDSSGTLEPAGVVSVPLTITRLNRQGVPGIALNISNANEKSADMIPSVRWGRFFAFYYYKLLIMR